MIMIKNNLHITFNENSTPVILLCNDTKKKSFNLDWLEA